MHTVHISLSSLLWFSAYWFSAMVLLAGFASVYMKMTPYDEFAMIKNGSYGPALSLAGAIVGFVLPILSAIVHSANIVEMIVWAIVSFVVQMFAMFVTYALFYDVASHINQGDKAAGAFVGIIAVVTGLVTAACLFP